MTSNGGFAWIFSIEWFNQNSGFIAFIAAIVALLVGMIAACLSVWSTLITQRGLRLQYQPDLVVKIENRQGIRFIIIKKHWIGNSLSYQI